MLETQISSLHRVLLYAADLGPSMLQTSRNLEPFSPPKPFPKTPFEKKNASHRNPIPPVFLPTKNLFGAPIVRWGALFKQQVNVLSHPSRGFGGLNRQMSGS